MSIKKNITLAVICILVFHGLAIPGVIKTRLSDIEYKKQRSRIQHEIAVREYIKIRFPDRGKFAPAYSRAVVKVAEKHDLKIPIIVAIASVESSWNHLAVSGKKAVGLMQVTPSVWCKTLKEEGYIKSQRDLLKPEKNLDAGAFIYKTYKKSYNVGYISQKIPSRKALRRYSGYKDDRYYHKVKAGIEDYTSFKKELFRRG